MAKMTPWFPGDVKPVHVGVYPRQISLTCNFYSYWNGKFWGVFCPSVSAAFAKRHVKSDRQHAPWRGLTEPAQQENKQ